MIRRLLTAALLLTFWLALPVGPALMAAEPAIVQQIHEQIRSEGNAEVARGFYVSRSPLVLRGLSGVAVEGAGSHSHPPEAVRGWNEPGAMQGTWIDFDLPPEQPAVVIEDSLGLRLKDFSFRHKNGGDALVFRTMKWRGNNDHVIDNVRIAVRDATDDEGETHVGDCVVCGGTRFPYNSADLVFRDCELAFGTGAALKTMDKQNVNYLLTSSRFFGRGTIVHIVMGGNVRIRDCDANSGIHTVARIDGTGPNVSPAVTIDGMRIDRSNTTQKPVIFDASRLAGSSTKVKAETVTVVRHKNEPPATPAVLWPEKGGRLTVTAENCALNGVVAWDERVRDCDKAQIITGIQTMGGSE